MTATKGNHERRRLQVRLSVLAGSAVTLAVSWLGVAYADGFGAAAAERAGTAMVSEPPDVAAGGAPIPAATTAGATLVPATQPTGQVVIVRRSRAS